MKKILSILLISVFCLFSVVNVSLAKDVELQVQFDIDAEFEVEINEYVVYFEELTSLGTLVEAGRFTDSTLRIVETGIIDLAPGKTTNIYVSAVYKTGEEVTSDSFPWKFTGKPFIIRVNKTPK